MCVVQLRTGFKSQSYDHTITQSRVCFLYARECRAGLPHSYTSGSPTMSTLFCPRYSLREVVSAAWPWWRMCCLATAQNFVCGMWKVQKRETKRLLVLFDYLGSPKERKNGSKREHRYWDHNCVPLNGRTSQQSAVPACPAYRTFCLPGLGVRISLLLSVRGKCMT